MVTFVFTNPRHHVEMMVPVAAELSRRGTSCTMISLAELRGLATPEIAVDGVDVVRAIPNLRRSPKVGAGTQGGGGRVRALAQRVVWSGALGPRMRWLLRRARVVVIPNDSVFPYLQLIDLLRPRAVPVVLMQEGIRFAPPPGYKGPMYGTCGAAALCAWGEGSAEHFRAVGAPRDAVRVTGNPRFDGIEPAAWRARGTELREKLGLEDAPLAFLSNPIENQGYGSIDDKLALFERFLVEAAPVLLERKIPVLVKNHLQEDPATFARVAERTPLAGRVHVVADAALFAVLAAARAAVVLTSTVGIEALTFGLPLAALEIPGHGFAFEYVARGAAVGLTRDRIAAGVIELLDGGAARRDRADALVERHLHDRGHAAANVADLVTRIGALP